MRLGFLSDLHIDVNLNMLEHAVSVVAEAYKENKLDRLFLAGDTSGDYYITFRFIDRLKEEGLKVYTIFGNHEYWSISYKDAQLLDNDSYINEKEVMVDNNTVVIGVDGLYDYSFVLDVYNQHTLPLPKSIEDLNAVGRRTFDLKRNKVGNYREVFDSMEKGLVDRLKEHKGKNIILMTHYVPSEEFVVYLGERDWDINNSFMGSKRYQEIAEEYGVKKVIFGHTHHTYNETVNGIGYHCNPIGYGRFEYEGTFKDRVAKQLFIIDTNKST